MDFYTAERQGGRTIGNRSWRRREVECDACQQQQGQRHSPPGRERAAGFEPLDFNVRPAGEACVTGWMPAASMYFRGPDDHLLEFIAMLPDERRPGAGVVPWREWLSRQPRQTG